MARTTSAKKAHRAALRRTVYNVRVKRAMRDAVRECADASGAKGGDMAALLSKAYQAIDKAAKCGVIKKNTASRMKSSLAKRVS